MIYLLLGEDNQAKDKKIIEIKAVALEHPEASFFDFESLDAFHLTAAELKKSLLALPAFSAKRLILIRHIHKLKLEAAQLIEAFAKSNDKTCDLILETNEGIKSPLKEMVPFMKVFSLGVKKQAGVFDITDLMKIGKTTDALKKLHELFDQGEYPLKMIGGLLWYWGKEGRSLGPQKFERGLKAFESADLNIKRSRLMPEYALEKLVVELVELQKR